MFNVLDTVVVTRDIPDDGLRRGDLVAIVDYRAEPNARTAAFRLLPVRRLAISDWTPYSTLAALSVSCQPPNRWKANTEFIHHPLP